MPPYNEVYWFRSGRELVFFRDFSIDTPYRMIFDLSFYDPEYSHPYSVKQDWPRRGSYVGYSPDFAHWCKIRFYRFYQEDPPMYIYCCAFDIYQGDHPDDPFYYQAGGYFINAVPPHLENLENGYSAELLFSPDQFTADPDADPALCKLAVTAYRDYFVPLADTEGKPAANQTGSKWRRIRNTIDGTLVYVQQDDSLVSLP